MISNQILQNTIDGLKAITRIDLCVTDVEGKVLAATIPDADDYEYPVREFVKSPADSQLVQGFQFFKVFDEKQLEFVVLARGDSGKTRLTLEEVKLADLMREAYEESVMIDEKHVYRFRQEDDPVLSCDAGLLKQAVRILIDNAAKYTREGDEIILSVGTADGHPYLQVQDCGIGMAESDARHMFERFYRADKARSFEGTGLGLSIAKWIVDKHNGHFEVLSRQDLGTRIRIVL